MIAKDQPTIFLDTLFIGLSAAQDGNMKKKGFPKEEQQLVEESRRKFLSQCDIAIEDAVLVSLSYDKTEFCVYQDVADVHRGEGMTRPSSFVADALVTREKNVALFLPVADCCPLVLHDTRQNILMLSHLGRHSVEQQGAKASVEYLTRRHHTSPSDIVAWLGPAAGKATYPLFAFDYRSLHEVITEQLLSAGLVGGDIEQSPIDVTKTEDYFSHSEFLKGHRESDGRFAVVAMLK
jgi:copper oxidase (laccase) domain-containing protein